MFPSLFTTWICFADNGNKRSMINKYQYLRPVFPDLDVGMVSRWLSICTKTHLAECNHSEPTNFQNVFPGLLVLQFIDLEQKCIIETTTIPRYATLSYVWGLIPHFRLTNTNKQDMLAPGSIQRVWRLIPRSIRDAIELVHRLEIRYLWVDAICLVQDDEEDKQRGIDIMDEVYERSWLTIIAVCGHDANAGLPGLHDLSREMSRTTVEVKRGTSLGIVTDMVKLLERSVYYSRAWT